MRLPAVIILAAVVIATAAAAVSAVEPVTQIRYIECEAYAEDENNSGQDSDSIEATDFDLFDEAVSVTINLDGALAAGSAIQNSEIGLSGFRAEGSSAANAEGYDDFGYGSAFGRSYFRYVFQVDEATEFELAGLIEAYDFGSVVLHWSGPDGNLLLVVVEGGDPETISESGTLAAGEYDFRVYATSFCEGDPQYYGYAYSAFDLQMDFEIDTAVPGTPDDPEMAVPIFALHGAAPNPFNPQTTLRFSLPATQNATLEIYDLAGRRMRVLVAGSRPAGLNELGWDGRDERGSALPSGTYFVRLSSGRETRVAPVVLLR